MNHKTKESAKTKAAKVTKGKPETSSGKPAAQEVKIARAKGRPMLQWVGKRSPDRVTAFPAQLVETYDPTNHKDESQNLLFHGDNKEVLAWLLANGFRGKANLIYIDPPFDSGADYVRRVQLRGIDPGTKLEGESYTVGEQLQYTDIWANDNYLQFMYERLLLLRELLEDQGSIILHANSSKGHLLRCLLDEVFGPENIRNEITWKYVKYQMGGIKQFVDNTDRLFWYSKGDRWTYNIQTEQLDEPKELLAKGWDKDKGVIVNLRDEGGKTYKIKITEEKVDDFWDLPFQGPFEALDESGLKRVKIERLPIDNTWLLPYIAAPSYERTGFPTQKPEILLERVVRALSKPGDIVLDCFIGSGTTSAVAQKLGRRWIGCDINKGAIQTTIKRLQTILEEQLAAAMDGQKQRKLIDTSKEEQEPKLASLTFSVYRVNDYDLQIQHNEAVNLACEHIGVERTRTDRYFDGKLGKRLVKIIPFDHPLSPLDLEELKNELRARPEEDRDITVVCLGKEAACDPWLEEWNRMRRQGRVPNQIETIELRTDPKYGKFFVHKPAKAEVKIARRNDKLIVTIADFLSPTIIERLSAQDGVLKPQITDWRSMVDTVMIDSAYGGEIFNIVLADVPKNKTQMVEGSYELRAPKGKTTVAVKITDMLGEEVLVTQSV
jgi:DNA modification methylase